MGSRLQDRIKKVEGYLKPDKDVQRITLDDLGIPSDLWADLHLTDKREVLDAINHKIKIINLPDIGPIPRKGIFLNGNS